MVQHIAVALALTSISVVIHARGMVVLLNGLIGKRPKVQAKFSPARNTRPFVRIVGALVW
jgi:hypothetical protein